MWEKILIGLISAILALGIKEFIDRKKLIANGRCIAALAVEHLEILRADLTGHIKVADGKAYFGETQYCEVAVADFLYSHITSNIPCYESVKVLEKTISFFHRYKVNMSTVKTRLDNSPDENTVSINEGTYTNLVSSLDEAIDELRGIAQKLDV